MLECYEIDGNRWGEVVCEREPMPPKEQGELDVLDNCMKKGTILESFKEHMDREYGFHCDFSGGRV
jgi:hypothetical protein